MAKELNFRWRRRTRAGWLLILIIALIQAPQHHQQWQLGVDLSGFGALSGRVIDASRHASTTYLPHLMAHQLVSRTPLVGSDGLFFESSSLGLQYYSFKSALEPRSFRTGTFVNLFTDELGNRRTSFDLASTARLLGINYASFTSTSLPPPDQSNIRQLGTLTKKVSNGDELTLYYLLKKISDTPLIEAVDQLPRIDPTVNLGSWWLDTDQADFITDTPYEAPVELNLSRPPVTDVSIQSTEIRFTVESDQPAPVVVKFTYSPYWIVESSDEGSVTQPIWVTPGQMLIYGKGDIRLSWHSPRYLRTFAPLSLTVLVALLLLLSYPVVKAMHDKEKKLKSGHGDGG